MSTTVADLQRLKPNWDGYEGIPPNKATLKQVRKFLNYWPQDEIELTPNPNGTVTIDIEYNGVTLSLELGEDKMTAFCEGNNYIGAIFGECNK